MLYDHFNSLTAPSVNCFWHVLFFLPFNIHGVSVMECKPVLLLNKCLLVKPHLSTLIHNSSDKFTISKQRQVAKKMESSKSTTRNIRQVASDSQVAQVNLMRHQRTDNSMCGQSDELTSSNESLCLQVKVQCKQADTMFPTPHHLISNLEYRLKPHHQSNKFLRARLDICIDVNVMPTSVYKLVFNDPDCKKLAPNKLEIGTYTDKVKLIGSLVLYMVHPDTKCLQEVTFFVASDDGSVLLSCVTTLALGLINLHSRLDHLSPGASLIFSSTNHPKRNESQLNVQFV